MKFFSIKSSYYKSILLFVFVIGTPVVSSAQCAMCRAALLTSGDKGMAQGINHGIAYLMAFPYILVAILGFVIYRIIKKESKTA